jgi:hypothetical protein
MIHLLEQYFIEHEVLDLPQLGTLRKIKKEANLTDNNWSIPKEYIVFDNYQNKPSSQFYNYLADNLDLSEQAAIVKLDQLVNDFLTTTGADLKIGSIGTFKHQEGIIEWETSYDSDHYFSPIDLPILEKLDIDLDTQIEPNNKWLIWSFSLLLIAVVLILYKYY